MTDARDLVIARPDLARYRDPIPRTAAVMIAWRTVECCIPALRAVNAMMPGPERVILVGQELSPQDTERLRGEAPPGTDLDLVDSNLGFPSAANRGIDLALAGGAEWVLLINDDATVAPDCLARCMEEAKNGPTRIAVVSPAIAFSGASDRIWYAGGRLSHWLGYTRHDGLRQSVAQLPGSSDTAYIPGCCALISAAAWRAIGHYRDDYFLYWEDAEWCYRARRDGWRCRYVGEVLCWHTVSASSDAGSLGLSPVSAYYLARNPMRFALDTREWYLKLTRIAGNLSVWLAYNLMRMVQARSRQVAKAYFRGMRDAFVNQMGRGPTAADLAV